MADNTESMSSNMVRMITPILSLASKTLRVASMPFRPGICKSIRMTCGATVAACVTASSPLDASPTTSKPSTELNNERTPSRKKRWSSARRTRIDVTDELGMASLMNDLDCKTSRVQHGIDNLTGCAQRQTSRHPRALLGEGFDAESSA